MSGPSLLISHCSSLNKDQHTNRQLTSSGWLYGSESQKLSSLVQTKRRAFSQRSVKLVGALAIALLVVGLGCVVHLWLQNYFSSKKGQQPPLEEQGGKSPLQVPDRQSHWTSSSSSQDAPGLEYQVEKSPDCNNATPVTRLPFILYSKQDWGGQPSKKGTSLIELPVLCVIISHTAGSRCSTLSYCSKLLRDIQSYHVDKVASLDIGYNFLISDDGAVYEGRGWTKRSFHKRVNDQPCLAVNFIGHYGRNALTSKQISAAKSLLDYAVHICVLDREYKLLGQSQTFNADSPGQYAMEEISKWEHYTPESFKNN
uniref:(California timema) hypothetical protein n=1 Tax=Timema californicum TaxID=61474 RepID=A0A7R9JDP1_TIMCA|nr:unnamed protein product [Timema californicum]